MVMAGAELVDHSSECVGARGAPEVSALARRLRRRTVRRRVGRRRSCTRRGPSRASFSSLTSTNTSSLGRLALEAGRGAPRRRRPRALRRPLARLRARVHVDHGGDAREAVELGLDADEARLDLVRRVGVGPAA